jgi:hypothetical protein
VKFAPGAALLAFILLALPIPYFAYWSWNFAARSGPVVVYEFCGRSSCTPYPMHDHGVWGFVVDSLVCGGLAYFAGISAWRFVSRYPCAIIMPDRLWLHPSFGVQPISFVNIGGATFEEGPGRRSSLYFVIYLIDPPDRNWVAKIFFWKRMRTEIRIRTETVRGGLDDLQDFRSALLARV